MGSQAFFCSWIKPSFKKVCGVRGRAPRLSPSLLELSSEEAGGGLDELGFDIGGEVIIGAIGIGADRGDAAHDIALADDRHGAADIVALPVGGEILAVAAVVGVEATTLDDRLQIGGERLVGVFLFGNTGAGDDGITVADSDGEAAGLVEGLGVLTGEGGELSDGGVLFKDDLALTVGVNFEGISFTDNIDTDRTLLFRYA